MTSTKKTTLIAIGISALLIAATIGLIALKFANQTPPQAVIPSVEVNKVSLIAWQPSIQSSGNLTASETATLKTEIAGRVESVDFAPSENVKKGQLLVELENTEQHGEVTAAKAQLASDKAIFDRYQTLIKSKAVSQSDFDAARYNYQISSGKLKQAESNFNKTRITAPFNGKIGLTTLSKGQYLAIGDTIATLVDIDHLYVDFEVPEKYSRQIKIGDKVLIQSDAYPDTRFSGTISALDSAISSETASLTVRADIPNEKHQLIPGSTVTITVYFGEAQTVVAIPQTALNYGLSDNYVYQWINNKAVKTSVSVDGQHKQLLIVTQGLSKDAMIITIGSSKVHNGQTVKIIKNEAVKP